MHDDGRSAVIDVGAARDLSTGHLRESFIDGAMLMRQLDEQRAEIGSPELRCEPKAAHCTHCVRARELHESGFVETNQAVTDAR